ncbi:indolepyruvate oxidoreductase subunit beta family protein [Falsiphaeobacter marinintestinus]|uniref:indolepyruvate oxidoreductase subunit beta family protein n=1 Tax=Falsiphaeobacter marinintestinus TaxID=1492905 RepID=UPI0016470257|nr:indolepyruvate oxidoreductase subunit beta family protein [Phaeobacter marinintestinus]
MTRPPLRILLAALGGEGGGVLMNWIVAAARSAGHGVQATSVPGVAQRTGSTSYYIEIAAPNDPHAVLSLVPMPGRVDVVVSSELVETARVMSAGFVSPKLTTLISSTARFYSTAEKISMGDGRFSEDTIAKAAETMAKHSFLLDLGQLAIDNGTFVSATMFGALAGSGVLPWSADHSRLQLTDPKSQAGFDAAVTAVTALKTERPPVAPNPVPVAPPEASGLQTVLAHGTSRMTDYQDAEYAQMYSDRAQSLIAQTDLTDHRAVHALTEACRRLALWMAFEDIARVADLKTRPERFAKIHDEIQLEPGQTLTITEYMKPRPEEIADILPVNLGTRIMARVESGRRFPLLGRGLHLRSNGIIGYRLLRMVAALKRIRRRSYRFQIEQAQIEIWLTLMQTALRQSPDFAMALAELPRVLKGYSDTLMRGKTAYTQIMSQVVEPSVTTGADAANARLLRESIGAALADDSHEKLNAVLMGIAPDPAIPNLKKAAHA